MRDRCGPFKLAPAIDIARQPNGSISNPAGALTGFLFKGFVEFN